MGGVISPLLCAALTLLLHATGAQQGWVEAPDGVVAANTEAHALQAMRRRMARLSAGAAGETGWPPTALGLSGTDRIPVVIANYVATR